jgi:type I restriction enzyme M protein
MQSKGATVEDIKHLSEDDVDTVKYIQGNIGYFIAYKDLLSTWLSMGKDFDVSHVRDALSAFSRLIDSNYKKVFDGIFEVYPSWVKVPAHRRKPSVNSFS